MLDDRPVHGVRLETGTPLFAELGVDALAVNSYHHQAIRELGEGLTAMAVSEDGLVEAIDSHIVKICCISSSSVVNAGMNGTAPASRSASIYPGSIHRLSRSSGIARVQVDGRAVRRNARLPRASVPAAMLWIPCP